ncbi:MAG: hypothetical protein RMK29_11500 [Myxococcales bacterium]|nr:hypothetical protein [Myxococcota bacterium]MDW8282333.1 hypothetical protein [Myxococcales bacterium]
MSLLSVWTALGTTLPPKRSPTLVGPEGDLYYAVFVGVVLVAFVIFAFFFYMRGGRPGGPGQGRTGS